MSMSGSLPLIIHDLQDSQLFALAQAAGRAGIPVEGTCQPEEPWIRSSRYVRKAVTMPCLNEVTSSIYALNLRNAGLSGVWLPCTDDMAAFTARYRALLEKLGMRFLIADSDTVYRSQDFEQLPAVPGLGKPFGGMFTVADTYARLPEFDYPLLVKTQRSAYQRIDSAADFEAYLDANQGREYADMGIEIQSYIPGEVNRMASAIMLLDGDSRVVRGFTGRRLRVEPTKFGPFGETTAARAEWIPELYEGASELLTSLGWQGFAEVECKQDSDGRWQLMEVNPRLSGWSCLAEADGAGLLAAYHRICADGAKLEEACLQRSQAEYVRVIATCYHDPDWAATTVADDSGIKRLRRLFSALRREMKHPDTVSLGAWDRRDLRASLQLLRHTIRRLWALWRGRKTL